MSPSSYRVQLVLLEELEVLELPLRHLLGPHLGAGAPPPVEAAEESVGKAPGADEPPALKKRRVLRWAGSNEPVRPGKATQRQGA